MGRRTCTYKKKLLISFAIIAVLFIVAIVSYKPFGIRVLEKATWEQLYSQGYTDDDIESVKIDHSYIAGLLGYGQWITGVIFKDEPYKFFDLPLDNFLIKLYNFLRHGLLSPFRMVVW